MKRVVTLIAAAAAFLAAAGPAGATTNRTFVSGHGSDAGNCALSAPCRTFAYAVGQTTAGGEVTVLDPAGYGTVSIAQSISIVNDGVGEAAISVGAGATGITISAGASDVVTLRGLTIVGNGGNSAIAVTQVGTLNIQNSVVRGLLDNGISFTAGGTASLNLADTLISNNGFSGVAVSPVGSNVAVTAVFERVQSIGNSNSGFLIDGSSATGTVNATVSGANASANVTGFFTDGSRAATTLTIVNSRAVNNTTGISVVGAAGTIVIANTAIAGNATGYRTDGAGTLDSYGNNYINNNATNTGSLTPVGVP